MTFRARPTFALLLVAVATCCTGCDTLAGYMPKGLMSSWWSVPAIAALVLLVIVFVWILVRGEGKAPTLERFDETPPRRQESSPSPCQSSIVQAPLPPQANLSASAVESLQQRIDRLEADRRRDSDESSEAFNRLVKGLNLRLAELETRFVLGADFSKLASSVRLVQDSVKRCEETALVVQRDLRIAVDAQEAMRPVILREAKAEANKSLLVLRNMVAKAMKDLEGRLTQLVASGAPAEESLEAIAVATVEKAVAKAEDAELHDRAGRALQIRDIVDTLNETAPPSLKQSMELTRERIFSMADDFQKVAAAAKTGHVPLLVRANVHLNGDPVTKQVMDQVGQQALHLASYLDDPEGCWQELVETLVPSVIDLCDESAQERSRSGDGRDGSVDFYRALPGALEQLANVAGLQVIFPSRGTKFDPDQHAPVKLQRTDEEALRETVAACTSRGYRLDGQLLRKASVTLYR